MNDQIRDAVRTAIQNSGLTQGEIAQRIGVQQSDISRLLSGRVGNTPQNWEKLLELLNLELTVQSKPNERN